MSWLALTFVYCIASALIPVINAEAYVAVAGSQFHGATIWAVAACAAGGQLVGKLAYYYLGHSSLNWRWVRKKTESPKWRERYERWQRRIGHNLWLAGLLLLVSATVGFPPFAIMSVLAGQLKVPVPLFVVVGFVGRLARFAAILGLVDFLFP